MTFVLDATVALAWCFEDEASSYAGQIFRRLRDAGARTPAHWPLEVANALLHAERHRRLTEAQIVHFSQTLTALPIVVEAGGPANALAAVRTLAHAEGLSTYAAAYLELAARAGLPLATLDAEVRAAAARLGVAILAVDGPTGS